MRRQMLQFVRTIAVGAMVLSAASVMAQGREGAAPGGGGGQGRGRGPATPPLLLTTTAWEDGGVIPDKYTQAAGPMAVSPALNWSQVPPGTQSLVLLMHDPEPVFNKSPKMDVTHWLVWNIPATATGLREGFPQGDQPDGTQQISLRTMGYMGPGAPPGPYHHYTFELYALDTKLMVPTGTSQQAADTRTAVMNAMDGHVLGKAILVARFHRQ